MNNFIQNNITKPAIVAHRGANRRFPENSLAAFKEAVNIAMKNPEIRFFMEMDLRLSKDGEIIIMHDSDVSSTTEGNGYIKDKTIKEISALKMKSQRQILGKDENIKDKITHSHSIYERDYEITKNPFFKINQTDMKVPTLKEVMDIVQIANKERKSPIGMALEIKLNLPFMDMFARTITYEFQLASTLLDKIGFKYLSQHLTEPARVVPEFANFLNKRITGEGLPPLIIFSLQGASGKRDINNLWNKLSPDTKLHLAHNEQKSINFNSPTVIYSVNIDNESKILNILKNIGNKLDNLLVIGSLEPSTEIEKIKYPHGIKINPNTTIIDSTKDIKESLNAGANFIVTNRPIRAIEILQKTLPVKINKEGKTNYIQQEISRRDKTNIGLTI